MPNQSKQKLIKIAESIGEPYDPDLIDNTQTVIIALAAEIRITILNKLKAIYATAIKLSEDDNMILFYQNFTDDDFKNKMLLEAAKMHLSDLTDLIEEQYLKKMWETRRSAYTKQAFNPSSQTSKFFQTEFLPETKDELKLSQQFKQAKQIYDKAAILINHLIHLNNLLSYEAMPPSHSLNTLVR